MTVRQPTPVDAIAESYIQRLAELDPLEATGMGVAGHDHQMTDLSPDGHAERSRLMRATLAELDRTAAMDEVDRVTIAAMEDRLGLDLELDAAGELMASLNVIASPVQELRNVLDLMPTQTAADWDNIAARVSRVPWAVRGYLASLRRAASQGVVAAQRQVVECQRQAESLADPKSSFFVTFLASARPDGGEPSPGLAADLDNAGLQAAAAYSELSKFLAEELLPLAPADDAVGRDRYALWSREFVGAAVDLDETYAWGMTELTRMAMEQDRIVTEIAGVGAELSEAIARLNADPAYRLTGKAALRDWLQETADTAISVLDGTHFEIPEPMRTIECRIAPTETGGIYYTAPSEDFSRPGRMWWSVPAGVTEFNTWRERTTVYHEGVPGHHLQIAQSVLNRDELNSWRRLAAWSSGHGEGWALYAERLMAEFGLLSTPGDRLGLIDGQRMRAARVVVDIGVHLRKRAPERWGGGVWDAEKAWRCLRANTHLEEATLRFELNRYLGWPGQAPSYKIGQRLWEQARTRAEAEAVASGLEFNLKEFHTRALNLGSLPLAVLPMALGLE